MELGEDGYMAKRIHLSPFIEPVGHDETSLTFIGLPETWFLIDCLDPGIDHLIANGGVFRP